MKKQLITLEGLSKAEQKVIIAKDVIANIKSAKYIASSGRYITAIYNKKGEPVSDEYGVKEKWATIKSCEVCGVGACLMSITKFKNNLTVGDLPVDVDGFEKKHKALLKSVFTPRELCMIEVMFEGKYRPNITNVGRDEMGADLDEITANKCLTFHDRTSNMFNSNKLLIAIMQNIINSNGKKVLP